MLNSNDDYMLYRSKATSIYANRLLTCSTVGLLSNIVSGVVSVIQLNVGYINFDCFVATTNIPYQRSLNENDPAGSV